MYLDGFLLLVEVLCTKDIVLLLLEEAILAPCSSENATWVLSEPSDCSGQLVQGMNSEVLLLSCNYCMPSQRSKATWNR